MGWFDFATRTISLEDKFIKSMDQIDGVWTVADVWYKDQTIIFISDDNKISLTFCYKYDSYNPRWCQMIDNHPRDIPSNFYDKIKEIATRKVMEQEIKKLGGYILDDDLAQGIKDAKTILSARDQVLNLTELIQKIREKYN